MRRSKPIIEVETIQLEVFKSDADDWRAAAEAAGVTLADWIETQCYNAIQEATWARIGAAIEARGGMEAVLKRAKTRTSGKAKRRARK